MTIPPETEAQILRYYHVEKWRIGTIARQLHVHYDTVARVLAQAGLPRHGQPPRPSLADPYLPFIRQVLLLCSLPHSGGHLPALRPGPPLLFARLRANSPAAVTDRSQ